MNPRAVFLRLIVPFTLTIALIVGVCASVLYIDGQRAARMQQIDDLQRLSGLIRNQLTAVPSSIESQSTQLKNIAQAMAARVTVVDGDGRVLLDSDADPAGMENHNDRPEIRAARATGHGSIVRFSHTLNQDAVYVAQPIDPTKPAGAILRLSYPSSRWAQLAVRPWTIVLAAALSASVLVLWLGMLLYRNWVAPVQALALAAGKLASGDWGTRGPPLGASELRDFSRRLNLVAEQAQRQLADLDARRSELQKLVDALPDPILLTDDRDRVVLINDPAARLLQSQSADVLGRKLTEVLRDPTLLSLFQGAATSTASFDGTGSLPQDVALTRNGQRQYYQAVATPTRGGAMLVLRNVTTMASAAQMKTDFVANASHELRTPITAIKMAFETLQDVYNEDPAQTARCLSIIRDHIQRLEEMLGDLLDLSRVENPDLRPELADVGANEIFAIAASVIDAAAKEKRVELRYMRDASVPESFESDKRLLNLILRNLLENSVKFTPAGGSVSVRVAAEDGAIKLEVIDTGIGIPPEHLERVFERFYQVDAARASAAGRGTGLGLAIVKHAMHALGGTVQLESTIGKGTTVTCTFPLRQRVVRDA